jgi:hypothetical protein
MANVSPQATATLGSFNAAPAQDAERTALACCASRTFAKAVADGSPTRTRPRCWPRSTPRSRL